MISKLVKDMDLKTKAALERFAQEPILDVLKTDNSVGNNMYLKSIESKANKLGITIHSDKSNSDGVTNNVLILKPEDPDKMEDYLNYKYDLQHLDIEGDTQLPTIKATVLVVEEIAKEESNQSLNILLLNRSVDLGQPLALELINRSHTVTVANSKSNIRDYSDFDLIITATGSNQDHIHKPNRNIWWVDLSYDISPDKTNDRLVQHVGRLTTSCLFRELILRH